MSYLIGPRLHFAGRFQADVSTVNNDPTHFNDATFKPQFQQPQTPNDPNGWWNPTGSAHWRLLSCKVTSAVAADGTVARTAADDPVVGMQIADGGGTPARLVDLDPEQQMVSQIWGLVLRLLGSGGAPAFSGTYQVAAFSDLWSRAQSSGSGDFALGVFYQSVLAGLSWGNLGGSRILAAMQQAATAGLSIKFNLDGYNMDSSSSEFTTGRIVGAIGPALQGEPAQFVIGRHCMPVGQDAPVSFFPAVVDSKRGKLVADFGNALPTTTTDGPIDQSLDLELGFLTSSQQFASLGQVPIGSAGWYEETAGICEFPANRALSAPELAALEESPIVLVQSSNGNLTAVAIEGIDGLHVRADNFVYRMSPGDTVKIPLYVSRFGKPLANATVALAFDASQLQGGPGNLTVGKPTSALGFPASLPTGADGVATASVTAQAPGNPRDYIDGQVYGVRYTLPQSSQGSGGYFNPSNFVSFLVWNAFQAPATPTWWGDVQPVFQQYANLYPVMKQFVDLGDYDSVVANADAVAAVFNTPETDPSYMPVTRDLSPAKKQHLLDWLATTGNGGKPNLGTPPQVAAAPAPQTVMASAALAVPAPGEPLHGKTQAMRRAGRGPVRVSRA